MHVSRVEANNTRVRTSCVGRRFFAVMVSFRPDEEQDPAHVGRTSVLSIITLSVYIPDEQLVVQVLRRR